VAPIASDLSLIHVSSGERRILPILDATKTRKLRVRWEISGAYYFSLDKDRLYVSERSRTPLQWRAEDWRFAFVTWKRLMGYPIPEEVEDGQPITAKVLTTPPPCDPNTSR
jgi:hypothetical protein